VIQDSNTPGIALNDQPPEEHGHFPSTLWPLVEAAREESEDPERSEALNSLVGRYRLPLLKAVMRHFQFNHHEAEDHLQNFLLHKILQKNIVHNAARHRGKFRTFLLTSLRNFVLNQIRTQEAQRRTPEGGFIAWDLCEPKQILDQPESDRVFDRDWAASIFEQAMRLTEQECRDSGQEEIWGVLKGRMLDPILMDTNETPYADLIARHAFASPQHVSNALTTGKRKLRRHLRAVIAEYAASKSEIESELLELRLILSRNGS